MNLQIKNYLSQIYSEIQECYSDEINLQETDFEKYNIGELTFEVPDWDYKNTPTGMELLIPNLRGGGQIPLNKTATDKFGFEIYGDCFLKI